MNGWQYYSSAQISQAIKDDSHEYIEQLSPEERKFLGTIEYLEDGSGQHAVHIEIPLYGTWKEHFLIYDKDNKRVKAIHWNGGHYRS